MVSTLIGWEIQVGDARKVKAIAELACKADNVDARVLADLSRRDLVPELWVPAWRSARTANGSAGAPTWCGSEPRQLIGCLGY